MLRLLFIFNITPSIQPSTWASVRSGVARQYDQACSWRVNARCQFQVELCINIGLRIVAQRTSGAQFSLAVDRQKFCYKMIVIARHISLRQIPYGYNSANAFKDPSFGLSWFGLGKISGPLEKSPFKVFHQ